ncbi:hypothetical protein BDY21DRAFT_366720 [Lineolata rhizophorae]|uniref:Uncharacterized protein n=1 Tax=Lineolata rhizophorae TaxID=578093 RepID=A0A6A6NPR5_9PEZI|nr:hypothetical protein BDY21DRAFT_366720 [Lineolata rhizophorae]
MEAPDVPQNIATAGNSGASQDTPPPPMPESDEAAQMQDETVQDAAEVQESVTATGEQPGTPVSVFGDAASPAPSLLKGKKPLYHLTSASGSAANTPEGNTPPAANTEGADIGFTPAQNQQQLITTTSPETSASITNMRTKLREPEPSLSRFESLFATHPTLLASLLSQLPTPSVLALYQTSRYLRNFLAGYPIAWKTLSFRIPPAVAAAANVAAAAAAAAAAQTGPATVPTFAPFAAVAGWGTSPPGAHPGGGGGGGLEITPEQQAAAAAAARGYALDGLLITTVAPMAGCLTNLDLDNSNASGTALLMSVLNARMTSLEHLSVRGCKNVSIKYHIIPYLHLFAPGGWGDAGPPLMLNQAHRACRLKSLYTYRCRHHRRRPYLPASLVRRDSDSEPTHELIELCHVLGIWTDTAWCPTPGGRCFRRKDYHAGRQAPRDAEVWVPFDRLWRSGNRVGPAGEHDSATGQDDEVWTDAVRPRTGRSKRDVFDKKLWEGPEVGEDGEPLGPDSDIGEQSASSLPHLAGKQNGKCNHGYGPLGVGGEGKHTPSHLRRSYTAFTVGVRCAACNDPIPERCEQCSIRMHCAGCRATLCASCAFNRPVADKRKRRRRAAFVNAAWGAHGPLGMHAIGAGAGGATGPHAGGLQSQHASTNSLAAAAQETGGAGAGAGDGANGAGAGATSANDRRRADLFWWAPGATRSPNLMEENPNGDESDDESEDGDAINGLNPPPPFPGAPAAAPAGAQPPLGAPAGGVAVLPPPPAAGATGLPPPPAPGGGPIPGLPPTVQNNNQLPPLKLMTHWCCVEPLFTGGGGIAFVGPSAGTSAEAADVLRAAPLPKKKEYVDPDFVGGGRALERRKAFGDIGDGLWPAGMRGGLCYSMNPTEHDLERTFTSWNGQDKQAYYDAMMGAEYDIVRVLGLSDGVLMQGITFPFLGKDDPLDEFEGQPMTPANVVKSLMGMPPVHIQLPPLDPANNLSAPRNLCGDCYQSFRWKVSCRACHKPLCKEHDFKGLRVRRCGWRPLDMEREYLRGKYIELVRKWYCEWKIQCHELQKDYTRPEHEMKEIKEKKKNAPRQRALSLSSCLDQTDSGVPLSWSRSTAGTTPTTNNASGDAASEDNPTVAAAPSSSTTLLGSPNSTPAAATSTNTNGPPSSAPNPASPSQSASPIPTGKASTSKGKSISSESMRNAPVLHVRPPNLPLPADDPRVPASMLFDVRATSRSAAAAMDSWTLPLPGHPDHPVKWNGGCGSYFCHSPRSMGDYRQRCSWMKACESCRVWVCDFCTRRHQPCPCQTCKASFHCPECAVSPEVKSRCRHEEEECERKREEEAAAERARREQDFLRQADELAQGLGEFWSAVGGWSVGDGWDVGNGEGSSANPNANAKADAGGAAGDGVIYAESGPAPSPIKEDGEWEEWHAPGSKGKEKAGSAEENAEAGESSQTAKSSEDATETAVEDEEPSPAAAQTEPTVKDTSDVPPTAESDQNTSAKDHTTEHATEHATEHTTEHAAEHTTEHAAEQPAAESATETEAPQTQEQAQDNASQAEQQQEDTSQSQALIEGQTQEPTPQLDQQQVVVVNPPPPSSLVSRAAAPDDDVSREIVEEGVASGEDEDEADDEGEEVEDDNLEEGTEEGGTVDKADTAAEDADANGADGGAQLSK